MAPRSKKWLIRSGIIVAILFAAFGIGLIYLSRHFEPYIREQAIQYLKERFDSEVELTGLHVSVPGGAAFHLATKGKIALAQLEGEGLVMRHKGRTDIPPMFRLQHFSATVDLQTLFTAAKVVPLVKLDGMEINIPPKDERPEMDSKNDGDSAVRIDNVEIRNAKLAILPRDRSRVPLNFELHEVNLSSVGSEGAMRYDAYLSNPKPKGEIHSTGTFGPWSAGEPSDTSLSGNYLFENADLGVFKGIAGILHSTGQFEGELGNINAKGEATIPDFRLKMSGNPVPLTATFEVGVDGTNGNTTLRPVHAKLGSTNLTTSGTVIKHDGDTHRAIELDALIPAGNLTDVLRLAMKGDPFMQGIVKLTTKIVIPPLDGKVKEKLELDGKFEVTGGKFLRSMIQDKIDGLSRRGQGKPKNQEIDEVVSQMAGDFRLDDQVIMFKMLAFAVAGAAVNLDGSYDLGADNLDFHGALSLDAKVSQTQSGWKRWVLKPIDPFFAKNGAGTFLKIKVVGSSKSPQFGLDR
ncbi:MAG: hypothetical protein ABIR70_17125 [Bryobacteraceae bacterium]